MKRGFTLLELLVTIGILAILAATAVVVVNPMEYVKQSRDTKRIGDMNTIDDAISAAIASSPNIAQGTAQRVYVSLPDTATNCPVVGPLLPSLPVGWSYYCVTSANYKKTNGLGWLPINFDGISIKSPLSTLPVDPVNNASRGLYYTYIPGGSYALSGKLESEKHLNQSAARDSGYDPTRIEQGSDLALLATAQGLVGYWPFDEGSGTIAQDATGNGNTGTWIGTGTHYAPGKIGQAAQFNVGGSTGHVSAGNGSMLNMTGPVTLSAWVNRTSVANYQRIMGKYYYTASSTGSWVFYDKGTGAAGCDFNLDGVWRGTTSPQNIFNTVGRWYFVTCVYSGSAVTFYLDGAQRSTGVASGTIATSAYPVAIGTTYNGTTAQNTINGYMDDVRIYNRALSAAEIQAMYIATK